MTQKFEYTILDMIESSARTMKTQPLNLGGIAGVGGGVGGPPGGFVGWLPQTRVAYDIDELATLATVGSGTLLDNLNHIRYRLGIIESGGVVGSGGSITVIDDNTPHTYTNVDTIHFSGAGVSVLNLGSGDIKVTISGGGGISSFDVTNREIYYPVGDGSFADLGSPYYYMKKELPSYGSIGSGVITTNTEIIKFITQSGKPGVTRISNIVMRMFSRSAIGDKTIKLKALLYKRSSGGTETLLETSPESGAIGNSYPPTITNLSFSGSYTILSTDRILIKITASATGGSTDTYVTSNFGLGTDVSRFEFDGYDGSATSINLQNGDFDASVVSGVLNLDLNYSTIELALDNRYLKLDTSNNPLTDQLQIINDNNGNGGIYIQTDGDAYTLDVEQYTVGDNITSPTEFLYRDSSGAGNITAAMIEGDQSDSGAGTISGDFINLKHEGSSIFKVTRSGIVNIPTGQTYNINNIPHSHTLFSDAEGDPADVSTTSTPGASTFSSRRDHVHKGTPVDGWLTKSETWTRTGNHTYTVSGDLTADYRKGTKVRYKDGGSYEYGVIASSSYSSPNTTINLIPNSDYAMAAVTITDKYLSYIENPQGFPQWFNWTVTLANTTTGNGTLVAKWKALPMEIAYEISLTLGSTSAISGDVTFTPPATSSLSGTRPIAGEVIMLDSGVANYFGVILQTSTTFAVRANNAAGTYVTNVAISATIPMTWGTSDELNMRGSFPY